jgi:hypothetical protein
MERISRLEAATLVAMACFLGLELLALFGVAWTVGRLVAAAVFLCLLAALVIQRRRAR